MDLKKKKNILQNSEKIPFRNIDDIATIILENACIWYILLNFWKWVLLKLASVPYISIFFFIHIGDFKQSATIFLSPTSLFSAETYTLTYRTVYIILDQYHSTVHRLLQTSFNSACSWQKHFSNTVMRKNIEIDPLYVLRSPPRMY